MSLPSYQDVYDQLGRQGFEPPPPPTGRPTRKGLGRYARDSIEAFWPTVAPWQRRWIACTLAYEIMLDKFDIRLPSATFTNDRIFVEQELYRLEVTKGQALKWARA